MSPDLRAVVLQHEEHEGLALLEPHLRRAGFAIEPRFREVRAGDAETPLVVVLGGGMAVYEASRHPFLQAELTLLRARVERGRPVLGICLGAQLLAAAAGARVFPGTAGFEVGARPIALTPEGRADPLFAGLGPELTVAHWHGDTFAPVPGAERLAGSAQYEQQAFRLGTSYGFQCHPELDAAGLRAWLVRLRGEVEQAGGAPDALAREAERLERAPRDLDLLRERLARHFARAALPG